MQLPKRELLVYPDFSDKSQHEILAIHTTFNMNLQALSLKYGVQTDNNRRILTDFLQSTYISAEEMKKYPAYF
jgi:hypothetical protein